MKNTLIKIDGVIGRIQRGEISEDQYDEFYDKFIELIEESGFTFGGTINLCSEEEILNEDADKMTEP